MSHDGLQPWAEGLVFRPPLLGDPWSIQYLSINSEDKRLTVLGRNPKTERDWIRGNDDRLVSGASRYTQRRRPLYNSRLQSNIDLQGWLDV